MSDREQTRRENVTTIRDALLRLIAQDRYEKPHAQAAEVALAALLAELEQAERRIIQLSEWYNAEDRKTRELKTRLAKADKLAEILRKTIYSPPGYSGPDMWWADEARAVLTEWEQA